MSKCDGHVASFSLSMGLFVCTVHETHFSFSFCHIFVAVNSIGYVFIKMFWAKNERPWRNINHNVCFILAAECPNRTHIHSSAHIFWLNSHFIFVLFLISINSSWLMRTNALRYHFYFGSQAHIVCASASASVSVYVNEWAQQAHC